MKEKIQMEAAEMRRAYLQEWRKRNPEKVRKYNREYWQRKAAKAKQEEQRNEPE